MPLNTSWANSADAKFIQDNGVKLVDPRGEMLEASWEQYATYLANAPTTDAFLDVVDAIVKNTKIDLSRPARVVYGRDTRPSGSELVAALEDGLKAMGAEARNAGITTTPIVHYLVRAINTKGTPESYGDDTEEGYYEKLSSAFKKLVVSCTIFLNQRLTIFPYKAGKSKPEPLVIDCANGVGTDAAEKITKYLGDSLPLILTNTATTTEGALNYQCGADYVKTTQRLPPSLADKLKPGQRGCSFDGDADRLMYFYLDERGHFQMLDGDKIAALVSSFIVDLVRLAGLEKQIKVGLIQTAYANGASTKYLAAVCRFIFFHSPN